MLPIFFSCLFHFISFRSAFVRARARATLSFQFRYTDNSNNNNQIASNANNCKSPCDTFQSVECKTAPFRTVTDFIGKASVWCAPKWNLIWQLLFSRSFSSSLSLYSVIHTLSLAKTNRLKIYHIRTHYKCGSNSPCPNGLYTTARHFSPIQTHSYTHTHTQKPYHSIDNFLITLYL